MMLLVILVAIGAVADETDPPAPAPVFSVDGSQVLDPGLSGVAGLSTDSGPADDAVPAKSLEDKVDETDADTALPEPFVPPEWPEVARNAGGILADRQVIAYYGNPNSKYMGVLGESSIQEMASELLERAAEYDEINGDVGVAPAFHIIFGTVWEDAEIGILNEARLLEYIEYAQENGIIVFLDHQIGKYSVAEAIREMLPYLSYENVHLAIDPEWATTSPGREIGQISAQDVNDAQEAISRYLQENGLPGPRMLVVHQFNWRMIADRNLVRADYPGVLLIHNADGFGRPSEKIASWEFNAQAGNMPLKGFKLFYPKSWRDGGFDEPLLTPADVMQLKPVPVYIQYQ